MSAGRALGEVREGLRPSGWRLGAARFATIRGVRSLLWIGLFLFGVAGIVLPLSLLYVASGLPPLDSAYSVEAQLRQYIEGERTGHRAGEIDAAPVAWPRPDFNQLPTDLVALYLSQMGCPNYFRSPRESGLALAWRAFDALAFGGSPADPNGRCEYRFAHRIAEAMRIHGDAQLAIAAYKLQGILPRPDLVAFDLASTRYQPGVIGQEDAARVLFGRKVQDLHLSEDAELSLAMPPNGFFNALQSCQGPLLIKHARDAVLRQLADDGLVQTERARLAADQPVACARR